MLVLMTLPCFTTALLYFQDTVNHLLLIFMDSSPVSLCKRLKWYACSIGLNHTAKATCFVPLAWRGYRTHLPLGSFPAKVLWRSQQKAICECFTIQSHWVLDSFSLNLRPLLSSGAEAGIEGNQRTARPSVPFHELPKAGRGSPCAPVLPGSR